MYKVRKIISYRKEHTSNFGRVPQPEVMTFTPSLIVTAGLMGTVDPRFTMPDVDNTHDMEVKAVDRYDLVGTNAAYQRLCSLGSQISGDE